MKKWTCPWMVMLVLTLIVFGCEGENNKLSSINGQLTGNSECKSNLKLTVIASETPDTLSCIEYVYDDVNNKLTIQHINAGFNCCPESLYCHVSVDADTIIISEFEANSLCSCNCLYDLNVELKGVETEKYQIKVIEPYAGNQAKITFEANLINDKEGSFCVTRKQYPWGM